MGPVSQYKLSNRSTKLVGPAIIIMGYNLKRHYGGIGT